MTESNSTAEPSCLSSPETTSVTRACDHFELRLRQSPIVIPLPAAGLNFLFTAEDEQSSTVLRPESSMAPPR